jgi:hypothetical protein
LLCASSSDEPTSAKRERDSKEVLDKLRGRVTNSVKSDAVMWGFIE